MRGIALISFATLVLGCHDGKLSSRVGQPPVPPALGTGEPDEALSSTTLVTAVVDEDVDEQSFGFFLQDSSLSPLASPADVPLVGLSLRAITSKGNASVHLAGAELDMQVESISVPFEGFRVHTPDEISALLASADVGFLRVDADVGSRDPVEFVIGLKAMRHEESVTSQTTVNVASPAPDASELDEQPDPGR